MCPVHCRFDCSMVVHCRHGQCGSYGAAASPTPAARHGRPPGKLGSHAPADPPPLLLCHLPLPGAQLCVARYVMKSSHVADARSNEYKDRPAVSVWRWHLDLGFHVLTAHACCLLDPTMLLIQWLRLRSLDWATTGLCAKQLKIQVTTDCFGGATSRLVCPCMLSAGRWRESQGHQQHAQRSLVTSKCSYIVVASPLNCSAS